MAAACAVAAALQELSGDARDWGERDALVHAAMDKFRLTLRSRPDFDRGCYNLGTVFYTFAMALQGDAGEHCRGMQVGRARQRVEGWMGKGC